MVPLDRHARPLRSLRLSVTDRCNLRCFYCMPEPEYVWLPKDELLSFEELTRVARAFAACGVTRLRLTGGEPLLRAELPSLVAMLAGVGGIEDLALTTNGVLLGDQARALKSAGLHRVTVSLDTLRPERFLAMTRRDEHARVLAGIEAARSAALWPLKLDTVLVRGENDDELVPLLEYAREIGAELRFIEYMDVGGATRWAPEKVVSRREILARLTDRFGPITPLTKDGAAPADRFALTDGTSFGVIASVTEPFCASCDRARVTADGRVYLCLYGREGHDLRSLLRDAAAASTVEGRVAEIWSGRADRGAMDRASLESRAPLVHIGELKRRPHLEMHTRGG